MYRSGRGLKKVIAPRPLRTIINRLFFEIRLKRIVQKGFCRFCGRDMVALTKVFDEYCSVDCVEFDLEWGIAATLQY